MYVERPKSLCMYVLCRVLVGEAVRVRDALKSNTCLVKCIKINPAPLICPTHTISARTSRPASRPSADFGASVDGAGQVSERPSARILCRARPQTYQFSIHSATARVVAVRRVESTNGRIGAVGRLWHTRLWRAKAVRIASIDVHARKSYRGSRQNSCACAPARTVVRSLPSPLTFPFFFITEARRQ